MVVGCLSRWIVDIPGKGVTDAIFHRDLSLARDKVSRGDGGISLIRPGRCRSCLSGHRSSRRSGRLAGRAQSKMRADLHGVCRSAGTGRIGCGHRQAYASNGQDEKRRVPSWGIIYPPAAAFLGRPALQRTLLAHFGTSLVPTRPAPIQTQYIEIAIFAFDLKVAIVRAHAIGRCFRRFRSCARPDETSAAFQARPA